MVSTFYTARSVWISQVRVRRPPALFGGTAQGFVKPFKPAQSQGVKQCLFVGEMASRRGVADIEFPAEFPEGNALSAAGFQGFLGGFQ